jgi:hypothetical protein
MSSMGIHVRAWIHDAEFQSVDLARDLCMRVGIDAIRSIISWTGYICSGGAVISKVLV